MTQVQSIYGFPIYVSLQEDADFENYGYYYEVFLDRNGDQLIDYGCTYDTDYERSLKYVCENAKSLEFSH